MFHFHHIQNRSLLHNDHFKTVTWRWEGINLKRRILCTKHQSQDNSHTCTKTVTFKLIKKLLTNSSNMIDDIYLIVFRKFLMFYLSKQVYSADTGPMLCQESQFHLEPSSSFVHPKSYHGEPGNIKIIDKSGCFISKLHI